MDSGDAFFSDNGENYTLREFFEEHENNLPKLILVTQGQCGLTDIETVPAYQVIRCHTFSRQRRVMAKAKRQINVSIPVDSQHLFRVNSDRKPGATQSLRDILRDNALPVNVEFAVDGDDLIALNGEKTDVTDFGSLQLTDVYEVVYLIGHGVDETELDDTPFVVPLYLNDVLLSTINGIKGKSTGYFMNLMTFFNSRMETMALDTVAPEDISIYSNESVKAPETSFETVEPYDYVKLKMRKVKAYAGSSIGGNNPQNQDNEEIYEDVSLPGEDKEQHASAEAAYYSVIPTERSPKTGLLKQAKGHFKKLRKNIITKRASIHVDTVSSDKKGPNWSWRWPLARGTQDNLYTRMQQKRKSWSIRSPIHAQSQGKGQSGSDSDDCAAPHTFVGSTDPTSFPTRDLSIEELALKMQDLHLGKYVPLFKENQIDGHIAVELTDDMLRKEFQFSAIEVFRFQHFLRTGHIPN
ncbi:uncharacterized protein [Haliotis cracherodii]|uniref:uncharacterized protein n=1 Tax=Haliotis cracherodii TaxID=6455 RepID=UPI0039E8C7AA